LAPRLVGSVDRSCGCWTTTWRRLRLSALIAYGSFLAAERLQVSGVIATVSAGLVFASQGWGGLSRPARELLVDVWEFGAFVGNSLLFLLIGLKVHLRQFGGIWDDLLWAAAITLVARFVAVYGFALLLRWFGRPFLSRQALLVAWSGLRGALGIALALSLPGGAGRWAVAVAACRGGDLVHPLGAGADAGAAAAQTPPEHRLAVLTGRGICKLLP